jgi:hypothetical protein
MRVCDSDELVEHLISYCYLASGVYGWVHLDGKNLAGKCPLLLFCTLASLCTSTLRYEVRVSY